MKCAALGTLLAQSTPGRGQMKVPHPRKGDLAAARSRTVSRLGEAKQLVLVIAAPGVSPEAKCF